MAHPSRRHRVRKWLALTVALFAVLGHVCVIPHEAHAVTADASESHGTHDSDDAPSRHDDALHAASCEAVTPNLTLSLVVDVASATLVAASAVPARLVVHSPRSWTAATSPPLFLLHSALRI